MSYDFSKLRIMIVDDSPHMRRLMRRVLNSFGISEITEVGDGDAAIAEIRHSVPDILITDYAMEPMNGIEFTHYIRNAPDSPNPYQPIIMVTGFTEMHRVIEARDVGVTEIVAKPVSAMALYSRFAAVVEKPRPFVRTQDYFGPDRRRRQVTLKKPDRRATAEVEEI